MSVYDRYYDVVRRIPPGRVTTYGSVAALADRPGHARQVGYSLAALPAGSDVPWHRVVNAKGKISARSGQAPGDRIQRALLEDEGVTFDETNRIDFERFGWP